MTIFFLTQTWGVKLCVWQTSGTVNRRGQRNVSVRGGNLDDGGLLTCQIYNEPKWGRGPLQ